MDYSPYSAGMKMDEFGTSKIKKSLSERSDEELLQIWAENNFYEWRPEAFEAIREILAERGVGLPEQQDLSLKEAEKNYEAKKSEIREIENKKDLVVYGWFAAIFLAIPVAAVGGGVLLLLMMVLPIPSDWKIEVIAFGVFGSYIWGVGSIAKLIERRLRKVHGF